MNLSIQTVHPTAPLFILGGLAIASPWSIADLSAPVQRQMPGASETVATGLFSKTLDADVASELFRVMSVVSAQQVELDADAREVLYRRKRELFRR